MDEQKPKDESQPNSKTTNAELAEKDLNEVSGGRIPDVKNGGEPKGPTLIITRDPRSTD